MLLSLTNKDRCTLARIIDQQKNLYTIVTEEGIHEATLSGKMVYHAQSFLDYPAVGDFVEVEIVNPRDVIHRILPRVSMLERKSAGLTSEGQIIATNLDVVFICMSMNENYNLRRLERYLSVVFASKATPIVLLTKSDLSTDYEHLVIDVSHCAPSVKVLSCTTKQENGFNAVKALMEKGKTYAFIGSSGVGKSTLVNALLKTDELKTFEVGKMAKGRHITTSRSLYKSEEGFLIIDTPGMRELQLDQVDFDQSFSDIESMALSCKFNDCSHTTEPGCAVLQAVNNLSLPIERLINYQKMKKEAAYQAKKTVKKTIDKTHKTR